MRANFQVATKVNVDTPGPQNVAADICVCTFRRVSLADTLSSLFGLALRPDWLVRVIVADNDALPSAQPIVEQAACKAPFPVLYVHAPMRNISVARNACLDAATARFVAFIDDDELATPLWLAALIDRQAQASAGTSYRDLCGRTIRENAQAGYGAGTSTPSNRSGFEARS